MAIYTYEFLEELKNIISNTPLDYLIEKKGLTFSEAIKRLAECFMLEPKYINDPDYVPSLEAIKSKKDTREWYESELSKMKSDPNYKPSLENYGKNK